MYQRYMQEGSINVAGEKLNYQSVKMSVVYVIAVYIVVSKRKFSNLISEMAIVLQGDRRRQRMTAIGV